MMEQNDKDMAILPVILIVLVLLAVGAGSIVMSVMAINNGDYTGGGTFAVAAAIALHSVLRTIWKQA